MNVSTVERFYANFGVLFDMLIDITPNDYDTKSLLLEIKDNLNEWDTKRKEKSLQYFIEKSIKYWNHKDIIGKKDTFLLKNGDDMIMGVAKNNTKIKDSIGVFNQIFTEDKVDKEDKRSIWKFFVSFIKQSIKYIHEKREPKHKIINQIYTPVYTKSYMDEIDLPMYTKQWGVELVWNV